MPKLCQCAPSDAWLVSQFCSSLVLLLLLCCFTNLTVSATTIVKWKKSLFCFSQIQNEIAFGPLRDRNEDGEEPHVQVKWKYAKRWDTSPYVLCFIVDSIAIEPRYGCSMLHGLIVSTPSDRPIGWNRMAFGRNEFRHLLSTHHSVFMDVSRPWAILCVLFYFAGTTTGFHLAVHITISTISTILQSQTIILRSFVFSCHSRRRICAHEATHAAAFHIHFVFFHFSAVEHRGMAREERKLRIIVKKIKNRIIFCFCGCWISLPSDLVRFVQSDLTRFCWWHNAGALSDDAKRLLCFQAFPLNMDKALQVMCARNASIYLKSSSKIQK